MGALFRQLACILSLCAVTFSYHSYQITHWLEYLCSIQGGSEESTVRSLLPASYTSNTRLVEIKHKTIHVNHKDDKNQPLCTRNQIKYGSWIPVQIDEPPYVSRNKHLRCYPEHVYNQSPWNSWSWQPQDESCHLTEWSAEDFCRLTNKTTVSIIGDSLSWEQYSSLLQLLGQKVRQMDQHKSKSENRNHAQHACGQNTRIVFRNDPRLTWVADSIQHDFPLIMVLNRGAHYVNDTELIEGMQQTIVDLHTWQAACRRLGFQCFLYWRTTVPGHPQCTVFNENQPVNSLSDMESRISNSQLYDNVTIKYHWMDFARQNELVLQQLADSGLEYNVIDGYMLNILRPDEHRSHDGDCLHNCYPGKMDVYNQILLHFLKMERSNDEIGKFMERYNQAMARMIETKKSG